MQGIGASARRQPQLALATVAAALILLVPLLAQLDPPGPSAGTGIAATAEPTRADGVVPLAFEPNRGQSAAGVDFIARTDSATAFIDGRGATLAAGDGELEAISIGFGGAQASEARTLERLPGESNYMIGDDRSRWQRNLPNFARVRYPGVYPGVSVEWYGSGGGLEYDLRLAPGADPRRVAVRIGGADSIRLVADGDLVIAAGDQDFRQRAPVAYQLDDGRRREVPAAFVVRGRTVSFELGRYDHSRPLVIDPLVLSYSTYLGGDNADNGFGIAVDSSGAVYVTGQTASTDFDTVGEIEEDDVGYDAFVSKLTPAGNALAYSTYLGGDADDRAHAIAVDSAGAAYVTGGTDSTDLDTVGEIEGDYGGTDAFIAKLTPAGNALAYSTYLGGDASDIANHLAVDSTGAAYITGTTDSTDFDEVGAIPGQGNQAFSDAFVAKLAPSGAELAYSTYLGGDGFDQAWGIAVDSVGAAYVTGDTTSTDFDTVGPIEGDGTGSDVFVSKLVPAGSSLAYSTYLGGNSDDYGGGIAVDAGGAAYITGTTHSTDFNTVNPIESDGDGTFADAFVSKLTAAGSSLAYSTYLGGANVDRGNAVGVDAAGAAHLAGVTGSTNFNTVAPIFTDGDGAVFDGFASKLLPSGDGLSYSTYLGGSSSDIAESIALDSSGAAYVAGYTDSPNFPTAGAIEGDTPGSSDAFVSKLTFSEPPDPPPPPPPPPGPPPADAPPKTMTCAGKKATIAGSESADTLKGTGDADVVAAGGGDDVVRGLGENDRICGGPGDDRLKGGGGRDKLRGDQGKDACAGGGGKDSAASCESKRSI